MTSTPTDTAPVLPAVTSTVTAAVPTQAPAAPTPPAAVPAPPAPTAATAVPVPPAPAPSLTPSASTPRSTPDPNATHSASTHEPEPSQPLQFKPTEPRQTPRRREQTAKRYQTQLYVTTQPERKTANAVVVRGNSALTYTFNLTTDQPFQETLATLAQRCRAGDNIQLFTNQPDLKDAATRPGRDLSRLLNQGDRTLTVRRNANGRNQMWQELLRLQTDGHLDSIHPNQYQVYVAAITDGRRTYAGALLHGQGQISLHNRTVGNTDLTDAELRAALWATEQLPAHVRLDLHTSPTTARILTNYTMDGNENSSSTILDAIGKKVTERHITTTLHTPTNEPDMLTDTLLRHARLNACAAYMH